MYKRTFSTVLILVSVFVASLLVPAAASSTLNTGINLPTLNRWSTDWPFVDEMKRAEIYTRNGAPNYNFSKEGDKVDWDENGWPRSLTPTDPSATFVEIAYVLFTAPYTSWGTTAPPAGVFQVMYEGEGTLNYHGGASKLSGAEGSCGVNCDRVFIDPAQVGTYEQLVMITISATNPDNHLRNIKVIWPGGLCDGDAYSWHQSAATCGGSYQSFADLIQAGNEFVFHPDFLKDLRDYQAIRFLNWQQINNSTVSDPPYDAPPYGTPDISYETEWADRRLPDFSSWVDGKAIQNQDRQTPARGAPIEAMVALANQLQTDAWLHIPYDASDSYISGFAALVKNSILPDQQVFIEYGNEPWNFGWPFNIGGKYLAAKGDELWGQQGTAFDRQMNYYAKRSTEICAVWKAAWGADADKLTCVLGSQAANNGVTQIALNCPLWASDTNNTSGENCASQVDAIAIAPYFGGYIGNPANESQVVNWTLSELFEEINRGGIISESATTAIVGSNARGSFSNSFYHSPESLLGREMTASLLNSRTPPIPLVLPSENSVLTAASPTNAAILNGGALGESDNWISDHINLANQHGLQLLAYEGGQHLIATKQYVDGEVVNQAAFDTITNLFVEANRDPRMGASYIDYMKRWEQAGGGLFMLYSSVTPATEHGSWGLKESLGQTSSPKRTASQQLLDGTYCWGNDCSKTLPPSQWQQISIPCEPGVENSVADFFADDIVADYGTDWVLFEYDAASGRYLNPGIDGTIKRGTGYWIIQLTSNDVQLDTPTSCSLTAPLASGAICTATKGCFQLPLATKPAAVQWNMSGYPLDDALPFNRYPTGNTEVPTLKITSNDAPCNNPACLPDEAEANDIIYNQVWRYDPDNSSYEVIEAEKTLFPWDGFWVPTLSAADGQAPVMVFPDY